MAVIVASMPALANPVPREPASPTAVSPPCDDLNYIPTSCTTTAPASTAPLDAVAAATEPPRSPCHCTICLRAYAALDAQRQAEERSTLQADYDNLIPEQYQFTFFVHSTQPGHFAVYPSNPQPSTASFVEQSLWGESGTVINRIDGLANSYDRVYSCGVPRNVGGSHLTTGSYTNGAPPTLPSSHLPINNSTRSSSITELLANLTIPSLGPLGYSPPNVPAEEYTPSFLPVHTNCDDSVNTAAPGGTAAAIVSESGAPLSSLVKLPTPPSLPVHVNGDGPNEPPRQSVPKKPWPVHTPLPLPILHWLPNSAVEEAPLPPQAVHTKGVSSNEPPASAVTSKHQAGKDVPSPPMANSSSRSSTLPTTHPDPINDATPNKDNLPTSQATPQTTNSCEVSVRSGVYDVVEDITSVPDPSAYTLRFAIRKGPQRQSPQWMTATWICRQEAAPTPKSSSMSVAGPQQFATAVPTKEGTGVARPSPTNDDPQGGVATPTSNGTAPNGPVSTNDENAGANPSPAGKGDALPSATCLASPETGTTPNGEAPAITTECVANPGTVASPMQSIEVVTSPAPTIEDGSYPSTKAVAGLEPRASPAGINGDMIAIEPTQTKEGAASPNPIAMNGDTTSANSSPTPENLAVTNAVPTDFEAAARTECLDASKPMTSPLPTQEDAAATGSAPANNGTVAITRASSPVCGATPEPAVSSSTKDDGAATLSLPAGNGAASTAPERKFQFLDKRLVACPSRFAPWDRPAFFTPYDKLVWERSAIFAHISAGKLERDVRREDKWEAAMLFEEQLVNGMMSDLEKSSISDSTDSQPKTNVKRKAAAASTQVWTKEMADRLVEALNECRNKSIARKRQRALNRFQAARKAARALPKPKGITPPTAPRNLREELVGKLYNRLRNGEIPLGQDV